MITPQVCIVILNWNGWQDTVNCLRSLRKLKYPNYHIILIDNGSTDESIKEITLDSQEQIDALARIFDTHRYAKIG
jgi:GT2 family glycosyltransferase